MIVWELFCFACATRSSEHSKYKWLKIWMGGYVAVTAVMLLSMALVVILGVLGKI